MNSTRCVNLLGVTCGKYSDVGKQISANVRRRKDFLSLPVEDQKLLGEIGWKRKLDAVDTAIQANARFLRKIVMNPGIFEGEDIGKEGGDVDRDTGHLELANNSRTIIHSSDMH